MINLCTCTGGSTSTIRSSKRRGGKTLSCKNCGGSPVIDGKKSSNCLLSTVLELTSLINPDFTWTKVSKGCRSSSRRPRTSNTIILARGELLTKDFNGLEMPVSESEKLGVSVLGCHFSEKVEHIPIKKRRFLFRASPPPPSNLDSSLEGAERHGMSPKVSNNGLQVNPNSNCVPAICEAFSQTCERGSNEDKLNEKELAKEEDFSGISILAAAACSNSLGAEADRCEGSGIAASVMKSTEVPKTVKLNEHSVKNEEPDCHTSTTLSKDESTLDNTLSNAPIKSASIKTNEEPSIEKSPARDVKFDWDLNTVMDTWEEPFVSEHEICSPDAAIVDVKSAEEKRNENDSKRLPVKNLPVESKRLPNENEKLTPGNNIPDGCAEIREPLSREFDGGQNVVVVKTESLQDKHIDGATEAVSVARNIPSENRTHSFFSKWAILPCQGPGGLGSTEAADTQLSMGCSLPPGFDQCLNSQASKTIVSVSSTVAGSGNTTNLSTTNTRAVKNKHETSLTTATLLENGAHQGVVTPKVEYKATAKMELTSNAVAMEDVVNRGTDFPRETDNVGKGVVNQSACGALPEAQLLMPVHKAPAISFVHDTAHIAEVALENGVGYDNFQSDNRIGIGFDRLDELSVGYDSQYEDGARLLMPVHKAPAISSVHDTAHIAEVALENGVGYDNFQSDNRVGIGFDRLDELSVGYDSQYEDGELRDSNLHAWRRYEGHEGENYNNMDMDTREYNYDMGIVDAHETSSHCGQENSTRIKSIDGGSVREADLTSNMLLPEVRRSSDEVVSGSGPNEINSGQENNGREDSVSHANQSDAWRMNVSGGDILPENQRISSDNFTRTRNFTGRKFSYREQKDGFETDDVAMKAEGSRFYRKEPLTCIGGPATHDVFPSSRGRFRMEGCSSKATDGFTSRPDRELSSLRSFGRGRYSPHRPSGRGGGMWNHSPERRRDLKRIPSPSYQGPSFHRSRLEDTGSVDDMANEGGMDPSDASRPNTSSYVTRRPYRSKSPLNQEVNVFRARLGLRPTEDTGHDRFVNVGRGRGRGRSLRFGARLEGEVPRGRYHGPASDDRAEFVSGCSHPFPRRRRCFSPVERRGNHSYPNHQSDSRSPPRPRTRSPVANNGFRRRSRSPPSFRPDPRMRRPRSPNYRDHGGEYTSGPRNNNSSPPSSRWVSYKDRVFDRRSPLPGRTDAPQGDMFNFYDSSRKPKQNEYYRSGHPGRFSDINEGGRGKLRFVDDNSDRPNNGYRRGGFVKHYNMDRPTKRFQYPDNEDGLGRGFDARDKQALELHARSNLDPKPCSNGTDSRFRDFPRRPTEDGDLKRRSREEKDPSGIEREPKEDTDHMTADDFQRRPKEVKEQCTTNPDSMPNEVVKEDDKPMLGSN